VTHWSLRRRVTVTFVTATVLTVLAVAVGALSFVRLIDARERVVDRYDPAAVAQRDLLAALLDQETAVRGFVITGSESFLDPYTGGIDAATQATEQLSTLLEGNDVALSHLDGATTLTEQWRDEFAEPEIARVRLFGPGESDPASVVEERALFDELRSELELLEGDIATGRDAATDDLERATVWMVIALVVIALVVFAIGVFSWIAWSRWTLRPLDRLGHATRSVATGRLGSPLQVVGPPEIHRLGTDVEAMRARIVHELDQLEAARADLDQRARDLARSNADLEQFAYVASHDLQEPLRKVTSFCQLLQRRYEGQLDERADQYIEFAVDGARRMQVLINDLLTFSRVGRSNENFAPVDLDAVARRAVADLEAKVNDAGGKVEIGELPTVAGDPTLLVMLFRNLVSNALKFRSADPPLVRIRGEPIEGPDGDEWCITVEDNGIGIEPEYAEKVFVIFQRLHSRDTFEGTGIGLAIAKRVVEFHGGRIWIDTERPAGDGASLHFTFPRTRSDSE
jgi:signal transduction histidine kinase